MYTDNLNKDASLSEHYGDWGKYSFLVLTLFLYSGIYGNRRKPKSASRRPDFEMKRPGFHGYSDVF